MANLKAYNTAFKNARRLYHLRLQQNQLTQDEEVEVRRLATELKNILMDIDVNVPGSHCPLWPYFVGGAESTSQIERSYFYSRLESIWIKTGSRNPNVAMRGLLYIWSLGEGVNWAIQIENLQR